MKKEEILKIIETRIEDLDVLIKLGGRSTIQKTEVEMWQFARNELTLVRDTIATTSEDEV